MRDRDTEEAPMPETGDFRVVIRVEQWDDSKLKNTVEMVEYCGDSQDVLRKYNNLLMGAIGGVKGASDAMQAEDGFKV